MTTTTRLDAVDALIAVARPIILEEYTRDSCIASTWVAIEALGYFGVGAWPFICRAMVWNALYTKRFAQGVRPLDDPRAWAIGIGYEDPKWQPRYPDEKPFWGHMVAITDDDLIDLSLDQVSRPERGLGIERPVRLALNPDLTGELGKAVYPFSSGGMLIYEKYIVGRRTWRDSNNWGHNAVNRRVVAKVIRAMRDLVE